MKKIVHINDEKDVLVARRSGRDISRAVGFGKADQTRLATAISELTRNALQHAGQGTCSISLEQSSDGARVQVLVEDHGPGIPDISLAMADGMSMTGGMGMGLPATRRLVHRFDIRSSPGHTQVKIEMLRPEHPGTGAPVCKPPVQTFYPGTGPAHRASETPRFRTMAQQRIPCENTARQPPRPVPRTDGLVLCERQAVTIRIATEADIHRARRAAKELCLAVRFDDLDTWRVVISVSELASNLLFHAHGGQLITLTHINRQGVEGVEGIKVICHDDGPGISNVGRAMEDGFSTAGGLGCGLSSVRRMMDELFIASDTAGGTTLIARKWRTPPSY